MTARDRIHALTELRDSGPGRPTQSVAIEPDYTPMFVVNCMPSVSPLADREGVS